MSPGTADGRAGRMARRRIVDLAIGAAIALALIGGCARPGPGARDSSGRSLAELRQRSGREMTRI